MSIDFTVYSFATTGFQGESKWMSDDWLIDQRDFYRKKELFLHKVEYFAPSAPFYLF